MEVCYIPLWTVESVLTDPETLYIFGDNDIGKGKRGQAVIRGLHNAMGIPTKRLPSLIAASFYSDRNFLKHSLSISTAVDSIIERCRTSEFKRLALPKDGFGTGLAHLKIKAPQVFAFLEKEVQRLIKAVEELGTRSTLNETKK